MPERTNILCFGACQWSADWPTRWMNKVLAAAFSTSFRPVEFLLVRPDETTEKWSGQDPNAVARLFDGSGVLFLYGPIAGARSQSQSVSFERCGPFYLTTISLDESVLGSAGTAYEETLGRLAGASMEQFDSSFLACGPELDLFEVGEDTASIEAIAKGISRDWRCWRTISAQRFARRIGGGTA